MRKLLACALAALTLAWSPPPAAAGDIVLVELFTSQGCSSCPPADRNLAALAERDDVLALSLHIDYWDYLGWRDTFGRPEHTQRQLAYRDWMGARVVYTPQIIVNGMVDVPGSRMAEIEAAIVKAHAIVKPALITIVEGAGMMKAVLTQQADMRPCTVWMASYDREATVVIRRGENAGRTITYHNVVSKLMRLGLWDGQPQEIALPQPRTGEGVAVWLQDDRSGHVLAVSFVED